MTRDDPFEKLLREERRRWSFPLGLCLAAIAATGIALGASALGVRWGEQPAPENPLSLTWPYVNVAVIWTWLLLWPATALRRRELRRRDLLLDALVLLATLLPTLVVAALLSPASIRAIELAGAVQTGAAIFTMGVLAWNTRAPAGLLAGITALIAVGLPVLEYVRIEFFPAWPPGWIDFTPLGMLAMTLQPSAAVGLRPLWIAVGYAMIGLLLMLTTPMRRITLSTVR